MVFIVLYFVRVGKQIEMKTIEVVAAIIVEGDKIFATQRGYGELRGSKVAFAGRIRQCGLASGGFGID